MMRRVLAPVLDVDLDCWFWFLVLGAPCAGLVENPMDWIWSSFSFYETGKVGLVAVDTGE